MSSVPSTYDGGLNFEDEDEYNPFNNQHPINADTPIPSKIKDEENPKKVKVKKRSLCWIWILLLTISFSGCIMCWSVEIAYATPYLEEIGLPKTYVSYNWLVGPLSALFIQPIVGCISDYIFIPCIGRRKPFLLFGTLCCAFGLLVFSWADVLGDWWFPHSEKNAKITRITLALSSFCILDGSINTLHSSIKTLVIDVVPVHQQTTANLYLSFFAGFGNSLGFIIGFIDFVGALKMKFLGKNIRPVYLLCCIWLCVSCGITFITTREKCDQEMYNLEKLAKKKQEDKEEKERLLEEKIHLDDEEGGAEEGKGREGDLGLVQTKDSKEDSKEDDEHDTSPKVVNLLSDFEIDEKLIGSEGEQHPLHGEFIHETGTEDEVENKGTTVELKTKLYNCCFGPKGCFCCIWDVIKDFPDSIIRAYLVRFMIYFAKFWCFVYMGDFVGRQIYGGTPTGDKTMNDRFNSGVRWASLNFGILSVFNMINSPIINFLSGFIPIRIIWMTGQSAQFFGLFLCYWIRNKWLLLVVFYWLSWMETCCISFPYAILNAAVKKSKYLRKYKGLVAGIFVSSQCFPEILVSTLGGLLVKWLIDDWGLNSGIMISVGGVCGGIALILILFIKIPKGMVQKTTLRESFCCINVVCDFFEKYSKKKSDGSGENIYELIKDEEDDFMNDKEDPSNVGNFEGIIISDKEINAIQLEKKKSKSKSKGSNFLVENNNFNNNNYSSDDDEDNFGTNNNNNNNNNNNTNNTNNIANDFISHHLRDDYSAL